MPVFTFSECRELFKVDPTFADNNQIETDGTLTDLPNLIFKRHGPISKAVENCRFHIHSTARGAISFHVAHSESIVEIGRNTRLNVNIRLWRKPKVVIGDFTTINQARFVADDSEIIVGSDCMFSDEILVQSADQHGLIDLKSMEFTNGHRRKTIIGDHVWIGRRSTLMPDVEIGQGSVVGAGSIVTKNAGPCSYIVGVPAKTVRENASWTRLPDQINNREESFFASVRSVHDVAETKNEAEE